MKWEIRSRNKTCLVCEKIFIEGDTYHCLLEEVEDEFVRRDYCLECWEKAGAGKPGHAAIISYWRGEIKPEPVNEKQDVIHRNTAEGLLRKYLHTQEENEKNLCYILALMLERKRILVHKDTLHKGDSNKQLLIYEHARTQEAFVIEDPQLSLERIGRVQTQVKELLDAETSAVEGDPEADENAEETDNGPATEGNEETGFETINADQT
jgi:hypothetical protein